MMRRTQRALLLLTATSSVRVNALAASRVFNVQLPKLPSGGELQLFEGLEDAGDDDDGDSLAELFTVGGTVWPCAASLCTWLLNNPQCVQGAKVLELGSGTGVCGLYAAASGAERVLLTDYSERLLKLCANNCERNMLHGNLPGLGTTKHISYETLLWNDSPTPRGPFDLVIGSDVTYEFDENAHANLAATLDALLRMEGDAPRIVLSHQHRNRSPAHTLSQWDGDDEPLQRFLDALGSHRLQATQLVWERPDAGVAGDEVTPLDGADEISIIEVTRCSES